jgi:cob(I)alamin adenosyltransferase
MASERTRSLVVVNTGHGKGKSSAAMGIMIRSVARGWKVGVVQFIKSGKWKVGEEKIGVQLGVDWQKLGDGFTWESKDLDETQAKAVHAWEVSKEKLRSGEYDMLILDEITYSINYGWVPVTDVVEALATRHPRTNVVLTGRDAPSEIVDVADTVTEMRKVKHVFDQGIKGRKGIEY